MGHDGIISKSCSSTAKPRESSDMRAALESQHEGTDILVVFEEAATIVEGNEGKMYMDSSEAKLDGSLHAPSPNSEAAEAGAVMAYKYPASFKLTVQLPLSMSSHLLSHPTPRAPPFAQPILN